MKLITHIIIGLVIMLLSIVSTDAEDRKQKAIESIIEFQMKEKLKVPLDKIQDYIQGNHNDKIKFRDAKSQNRTQNDYETVVSGDNVVESELSAVINPTDSTNMIVSPIRQGDPLGLICPVYYTKDFGQTWKKSNFITRPDRPGTSVIGGGDPVLAFDADGKAYLTWINLYITLDSTQTAIDSLFAGVFWAYSNDGGETWHEEDNKVVGDLLSGNHISQGMAVPLFGDKQWVAADQTNSHYKNNLYTSVTAMVLKQSQYEVDIRVYTKEAANAEFNKAGVDITSGVGLAYQFSYLDVDRTGNVHVVFSAVGSQKVSYYHTVSKDGGKTFSTPTEITQYYGTEQNAGPLEIAVGMDRLFPCPAFAIDKTAGDHAGNLYFSYTASGISSNKNQGLDVYYCKSTDGGTTWSEPKVLNEDEKNDNTHNYYSTLQVNEEGILVATWYDRRHDDNNYESHYYLTYSFDGGETFMHSVPITSVASDFSQITKGNNGFGIGEYTQTVMTKGYAIPFWADGRTNNGNINIYCAKVPIEQIANSVESIKGMNSGFEINKVYPNPSDEQVTVEFTLEHDSQMRLVIFDINGNSSLEVFDNFYTKGQFSSTIDLSKLPSGEYYIRLESSNAYEVQKLKVIK